MRGVEARSPHGHNQPSSPSTRSGFTRRFAGVVRGLPGESPRQGDGRPPPHEVARPAQTVRESPRTRRRSLHSFRAGTPREDAEKRGFGAKPGWRPAGGGGGPRVGAAAAPGLHKVRSEGPARSGSGGGRTASGRGPGRVGGRRGRGSAAPAALGEGPGRRESGEGSVPARSVGGGTRPRWQVFGEGELGLWGGFGRGDRSGASAGSRPGRGTPEEAGSGPGRAQGFPYRDLG